MDHINNAEQLYKSESQESSQIRNSYKQLESQYELFFKNSLPVARDVIMWLKSKEPSAQVTFHTPKGKLIDAPTLVAQLVQLFHIENGGAAILPPAPPPTVDYSLTTSVYLGTEQQPIRDKDGNFTAFGREQVMRGLYLCSKLDDEPRKSSKSSSLKGLMTKGQPNYYWIFMGLAILIIYCVIISFVDRLGNSALNHK